LRPGRQWRKGSMQRPPSSPARSAVKLPHSQNYARSTEHCGQARCGLPLRGALSGGGGGPVRLRLGIIPGSMGATQLSCAWKGPMAQSYCRAAPAAGGAQIVGATAGPKRVAVSRWMIWLLRLMGRVMEGSKEHRRDRRIPVVGVTRTSDCRGWAGRRSGEVAYVESR